MCLMCRGEKQLKQTNSIPFGELIMLKETCHSKYVLTQDLKFYNHTLEIQNILERLKPYNKEIIELIRKDLE